MGIPIKDGNEHWYRSRKEMYICLIYYVCKSRHIPTKQVQATDMHRYIEKAPWFEPKKVHGTFGSIKDKIKNWSFEQLEEYVTKAKGIPVVLNNQLLKPKIYKIKPSTTVPKAPKAKVAKPKKRKSATKAPLPAVISSERIESFRKEARDLMKLLETDELVITRKTNGSYAVSWTRKDMIPGDYIRRRKKK